MQGGSIRLFKIWGIAVFLHFSWFIVAAYQMSMRRHVYTSPIFALYEYLALFVIVLMHEFGHALACRQTGGIANRIMLWPLGGIAFVQPPQRAGAQLWAIAAGPLVNVALIPVLFVLQMVMVRLPGATPDTFRLFGTIALINYALLFFNLLPIYPLDGGQILRSLLWFPFGPIRSLQVASAIGFVGSAVAGVAAVFYWQSIWIGVLAFFLISQAVAGWRHAQALAAEQRDARLRPEVELERPPVL
ncbi:MAG: site-2 protease family protein [Chthoniobacterales bacterium]